MRKILFASSEIHPLIKTGGLADVSASLPAALARQGQSVRLVMPAYQASLNKLDSVKTVATVKLDGYHRPVNILESRLPQTDLLVWLVDSPEHFAREGIYSQPEGLDWPDNAARFAVFCRAVVALAFDDAGLDWQPDIVHCHDWQTGLVPALMSQQPNRPASVFTIHNLAYQGVFDYATFQALDLPQSLWNVDGLEFYGQMSFMKAGLVFADHLTTVSPTYAREICEPEYGCGLEGLLQLRHQQGRLTGILNGIDTDIWNPATDALISRQYSAKTLRFKTDNKTSLQQRFFLPPSEDVMLVGLISRLVSQKGIDLALSCLQTLLDEEAPIQVVCLGSGDKSLEQGLRVLQARHPDKVAITIGYDETLAHQIEAGSDVFLMPSRFEPCGLNQMYSLRYGTLPLVRRTGGLADTVVDANENNRKMGTANGFSFQEPTPAALLITLRRALSLFAHPRIWRKMKLTAMQSELGWDSKARQYLELYSRLDLDA